MLNMKVTTWSLMVFTTFSFIVCVIFGLIVPSELRMHQFLQNVLPGFKWLSIGSFFLGLIESGIWGVYVGLVFTSIYNFFHKKWIENNS